MADNVIVRVPEQQFIRGEDGYSPEVTIEDIAHGHRITITDREHPEGQTADVLDGDSAYEQAVAGGYTGTEAQFNEELASFKELSEQAADSAQQAASGASTAQYYMNSAWNAVNSANLAKVSAESAAAQALIRMNSAATSAQAAEDASSFFTSTILPNAVTTINNTRDQAVANVNVAKHTAVQDVSDEGATQISALQTESTTQQAAIQQKGEDVLESIPADYTELTEDVDDLKSANDYVIKTKFPDTFEAVPFISSGGFVKGRINTTTGGNASSTTRARRYNSVLSGNYISLGTDDYEYTLFYYDGVGRSWADTYTYVYSDWIKGSTWTLIDESIGDRARVVVRHPDDSTISDADLDILTRVCVARYLDQITPQITTKKGNPVYIGELEALARDWYSHRNDIVSGSKAMVYGNNSILNTSSYTREIDCSTFVGMLLRGYSFSQTPYATGQGASPDSWTGNTAYNWTFNPFDYSNYSRIDSQSRTKVRYASQMAEMMIERGQTVQIDRYYANIEPGDVLFFARYDSTTNDWFEPLRFKHINHVAICIGKEKATSADGWDTATYPWKHIFAEVGHEDETTPDGVIKIRTLEQPQGDASAIFENNINTLCLVCRPDLGSISDDYTELTEDVAELQSAFSLEPLALQYTSSGIGFVKYADGTIGTSELSSHTDYVDISGYPCLYYKRQGSNANNPTAGMAFYDENKLYICGESTVAQQAHSGYMTDLKKIAVPPNAKYARFSTYSDVSTYGAFEVYGESIIADKVNETADIIAPLLPESLPFGLTSGQYVYSDGVITKAVGWYTTTYIDVTNISRIIYTRIATPEIMAYYGIAWFDENKEVLANTGTGSVQYAQDYSYVLTVKDVPTGAKYIMLTVMDRDNLNLPFGIYDFAEYEKALAPNAKRYAPVVGSPRLYLATTPVDPDFDIRSSSSGGTSYSDIYGRYDALCASYPHWIKRDTDIGVDSENNPIARYTVRMYDPLVFLGDDVRTPPFTNNVWENSTQYRRALLTAGVHGNERVGVMGLYYLIKDILSSNDEWARYIKSNYILEIIPIINPGGFNANRRRNGNNIDINRDYMKKTSVEAQVMTTFIQSIKNDLYCAMDFHGSYELGFLATPQNSHIINKMMTLATQTISACADDWEGIESIIGNTSDYYPYAYGCLSQNSGTLPYYILMNNITPYAFTVESPCLLLDTTVQANSAKVVAAAKMAMDQGCNVLQALLSV